MSEISIFLILSFIFMRKIIFLKASQIIYKRKLYIVILYLHFTCSAQSRSYRSSPFKSIFAVCLKCNKMSHSLMERNMVQLIHVPN